MSSLYAMLTELLPYIKEQGASAESVQAMETWLLRHLHYNAANATRRALAVYGCPLSDGLIEEIEQHGSVATFVKALLAGFPLESMHELEVENQVLKQIIAAKEIKKKSLH